MKAIIVILSLMISVPAVSRTFALHHNYTHHLNVIESRHQIPEGLLHAIAKVESGRWNNKEKQVRSWPWVIHAQGEGHYFATKELAVEAIKVLQAKGVKNIDVGLMQINLLHHPNAFESLEDALDPKQNIEYAARFLKGLKQNHKTWKRAVAYYHSASPTHHIPYTNKVLKAWRQEPLRKDYYATFLKERSKPRTMTSAASKFENVRRTPSSPSDRLKVLQERLQFHHYNKRNTRSIESRTLRYGKVYRLRPINYTPSSPCEAQKNAKAIKCS